jgi:hypothetical protein
MARSRETRLVFECGVMRFDASANLFVHLTHSADSPHAVVIDGGASIQAPASDRRARVDGSVSDAAVSGQWPEFTASLPRGLVVEVRAYDSLRLSADGSLVVVIGAHEGLPLWFQQGGEHLFRRDGEKLRMWDKSSRPEIRKGKETVAKKTSTAKAAEKAEPKKATPKKAEPKKATPKKAEPKKATPKKATPKKATPKKATPKKATPKKATPKKATPKKATPKKATPKKATPKKATPKKEAPKKEAPAPAAKPSDAPEPAPAAAPSPSRASEEPASQWAGAQSSYGTETSRSQDTGGSGPLGCLSLTTAFAIGSALLAILS